jgi:predicted dehydrogenase
VDRVQMGIIGLGTMGEEHAKVFCAHPLAEVVAVSDCREEAVDSMRSRYSISAGYTDYRKMLERSDLDAVVIATPDNAHFAPARDVLESGKHALIEKPLATTVSEADELIRISRRTGKKVQVCFNNRWLPSCHLAKVAIGKGEIGQPLAGYTRKNVTISVPTELLRWAQQSSPAWFLSSHDIDLVRWFLDAEPTSARAWGRKEVLKARGIDTYDVIQAQLMFSSGAFVTFESAWIYPNTLPSTTDCFVEIVGTSGHIHLDRKTESIEMTTAHRFSQPKGFINSEVFGRRRGAFPACLEDFLFVIRENANPHVTVVDGRQVTAALDAIHRSLDSGQTEAVLPLPEHGGSL